MTIFLILNVPVTPISSEKKKKRNLRALVQTDARGPFGFLLRFSALLRFANLCLNNFTQLLRFLESWEMNGFNPTNSQQQHHPQHHPIQHPLTCESTNKILHEKKKKQQQGGSVFINDASVPRSVYPSRFCGLVTLPPVKGPRVRGCGLG